MDVHDLVAKIKAFVAENGRVPTRGEMVGQTPGLQYFLAKGGTTWTQILHNADLPSYSERQQRGEMSARLTNEIFARDIPDVLAEHKPLVLASSPPALPSPTLVIPDTHFPWVNPRVLEAIYAFVQKHKPSRVIQIGDLYDMYCHAKFPRSQNLYKPKEEEELGRKGAEEMWKTIRGLVPEAECVQLKGNHDVRPLKRTLEGLPTLEHVVAKHLDQLMTFEGVNLIADARQEYIVGDTEFIHGYRSKLGDHRDYAHMNAVCGHVHVGGVVYRRIRGRTLFELNAGLAGDPESKVFGYTPQRITHWTPGFGFIDEYGARFIPE